MVNPRHYNEGHLDRFFPAVKHVNPMLTGLVKDNPATLRGFFSILSVLITHELKLTTRADKPVSSFAFTVSVVTSDVKL